MSGKEDPNDDSPRNLAGLQLPPPSPDLRERVLNAARTEWAAPSPALIRFPAPAQAFAAAAAALLIAGLAQIIAERSLAPWQAASPPAIRLHQAETTAFAGLHARLYILLNEPS